MLTRPATLDDIPTLVRIHAQSWPETYAGLLPQYLLTARWDAILSPDRCARRAAVASAPFTALVLEGNAPACRFYAASGGKVIAARPETIGDAPICEQVYGWSKGWPKGWHQAG